MTLKKKVKYINILILLALKFYKPPENGIYNNNGTSVTGSISTLHTISFL